MDVLLILAHADDETLGVGGTILKLKSLGHQVRLVLASDGQVNRRSQPADNIIPLEKVREMLKIDDVQLLGFEDQAFDRYPIADIAQAMSKHFGKPDLIITHSAQDLNRDHRLVAEAARIVGRPRGRQISMLACEIPAVATWNAQRFAPQFYVDISPWLEDKVAAFSLYATENRHFPDPYSAEGLRILAQFRGMECGYEAAEAFEVLRWYDQHHFGG